MIDVDYDEQLTLDALCCMVAEKLEFDIHRGSRFEINYNVEVTDDNIYMTSYQINKLEESLHRISYPRLSTINSRSINAKYPDYNDDITIVELLERIALSTSEYEGVMRIRIIYDSGIISLDVLYDCDDDIENADESYCWYCEMGYANSININDLNFQKQSVKTIAHASKDFYRSGGLDEALSLIGVQDVFIKHLLNVMTNGDIKRYHPSINFGPDMVDEMQRYANTYASTILPNTLAELNNKIIPMARLLYK